MTNQPAGQADATRRPTLAHVAELAAVSLKTASRVLGGEPHVSAAKRERVFAAAQLLGYRRNAAASLLARGQLFDAVGLITTDLANPFYPALAKGLEDELRTGDLLLTVSNSGESPEVEWSLARNLADRQTKALIVASAMADHTVYEELQDRGMPVIFVDRPVQHLDADAVVFDNVGGGRAAALHLLSAGHRRIAFIGDYDWLPTHRDRLAGMAGALEAAGVTDWRRWLRTGAHDVAAARTRVAELLDTQDPPTAFFAGNNRALLGVVEELVYRAPDPLPAVVGFDNVEWARVLGVTVVADDPEEMGRQAGRLALARLADRDRPTETVVLPTTLISHGSGERRAPVPA
ncbi:LacI family DNA-binding transcriptional regulator [Dactylosporangium cerinum]|uniref:LacI family DNA-binding transcriptional regulator n=1 Tax=Dactylosporangium cerinum TaxID=1434730 RepID=A0ABV9WE48_9ACTN